MAKFGFDLNEVEADIQQDYRPFPKGDYKLQAVEAEEKETAKKKVALGKLQHKQPIGSGTAYWSSAAGCMGYCL